jgi:hypothetical protein
MKREVVQDFLNLPGIAGVALIDGRSRPYFCGVDQTLNSQQREALAQGIQQVVETTPPDFQFFKFQFVGYQVHIYKLDHGVILLVLASSELQHSCFDEAIDQLKMALRADTSNAIATFRLLAGNMTLSGHRVWQHGTNPTTTVVLSDSRTNPQAPSRPTRSTVTPPGSTDPPSTNSLVSPTAPATSAPQVSLAMLLADLNHLSQFTTQYLGTAVVTNYWKTTRPAIEWLNRFEIDRSARISDSQTSSSGELQIVCPEHLQAIREWVTAFIARCSKVIRDFATIIQRTALDDRQKTFLLSNSL